jgi:predicted nucleic acid-binding protein
MPDSAYEQGRRDALAKARPTVTRGLLDTNIVIQRRRVDPVDLPDEVTICSVTLAELSAGPHYVLDDGVERARRLDVLQRAEADFDPIPFGTEAARAFGRVSAAVLAAGRKPRARIADLMIAAVAVAEGLPLYTTNPADFVGLDGLVDVVPVTLRTM